MKARRTVLRTLILSILASGMGLAHAQSSDDASIPPASTLDRFELADGGMVLDKSTGLTWAGKGSNGDLSWTDAQNHCAAMGAGWTLPSTDDLVSLYLPDATNQGRCIGQLSCNITPMIEVSGLTFWSDETDATGSWYVYFVDGKKYSTDPMEFQGKRALCVHRP